MANMAEAWFLRSLYVAGFKSFSTEHPQTFEFCNGLNVIHGANGAGKSNVMDAICFALTISEKDLRVQRLRQLLHSKDGQPEASATVELIFARRDGQEDQQTLTARLFRDADERRYKWQGRRKTQHEVRRCLRQVGVEVEQPCFLIFQNTVMGLVLQSAATLAARILRASGGKAYAEAEHEADVVLSGTLRDAAGRVERALQTAALNAAVDREELQHLLRLREVEGRLAVVEDEAERTSAACLVVRASEAESELKGVEGEEVRLKEE
eukprot:Hpha_TRINITY_DN26663_c0_g1::TRINITY_DN26663_c0_g1_i1::g.86109::m.86109